MSHKTIFEFNGHTAYFDIGDADLSEKYEKAIDILAEDEKSLPKDGKISAITKAQCAMIRKFFDNCLGKGKGKDFCTLNDEENGVHSENNIGFHYEAYYAFINFVAGQKNDLLSYKNTYSQYSNRQQRRAASKKK